MYFHRAHFQQSKLLLLALYFEIRTLIWYWCASSVRLGSVEITELFHRSSVLKPVVILIIWSSVSGLLENPSSLVLRAGKLRGGIKRPSSCRRWLPEGSLFIRGSGCGICESSGHVPLLISPVRPERRTSPTHSLKELRGLNVSQRKQ